MQFHATLPEQLSKFLRLFTIFHKHCRRSDANLSTVPENPIPGELMKRILISVLVVGLLVGAFAISGGQKSAQSDLQIDIENRNPWTHQRSHRRESRAHLLTSNGTNQPVAAHLRH
jgi:hypothetical protein